MGDVQTVIVIMVAVIWIAIILVSYTLIKALINAIRLDSRARAEDDEYFND